MESNLAGYMLRVCEILNKHAIEYMIVGGVAMAFHGYYRKSITLDGTQTDKPDIDIWYNPTYGNYFRLLDALEELGQDISKLKTNRRQTQRDPSLNIISMSLRSISSRNLKLSCHF